MSVAVASQTIPNGPYGRGFRMGAVLRLLPLAACLLSAGCVTTGTFSGVFDYASTPDVQEVTAVWDPHVGFSHDPVNGGVQVAALVGRVYLFDSAGLPVSGSGEMSVSLWLDGGQPDGKPKNLEIWNLDDKLLRKMLHKDRIGDGYTMILPWGTYREDIQHVQITVSYTPKHGSPMFAPCSPLTLQHPTRQAPAHVMMNAPQQPVPPGMMNPGQPGPQGMGPTWRPALPGAGPSPAAPDGFAPR